MFRIIIEADYALFTRLETKVERTSYPVPTPSALMGLLKSVYWKPSIAYRIHRIVVYRPIEYASIRRNEVKDKVLLSAVKRQMAGGEADPCIYTKESISQRSSVVLRNVRYGVEFSFVPTGIQSERDEAQGENFNAKHASIIRRRLENGQCFRQPVMGCREFPVKRISLVDEFDLSEVDESLKGERDLGIMLFDMRYEDEEKLKKEWSETHFSDRADPIFYHPIMVDGVIDVDRYGRDRR